MALKLPQKSFIYIYKYDIPLKGYHKISLIRPLLGPYKAFKGTLEGPVKELVSPLKGTYKAL